MGGRVALVTGGSRGIGAATAMALARDGHRVAVTYSKDQDGADDVVADLDRICGGGLAVRADVRDPESVDAAFAKVEETWGPVEVLVANAGVTADGLIVR
ncbi:MAG: SDR family NAD(P)-dependent oxidoreductase, partial [Acidimicrobiia bacterium]|nr:SDR family NAD(P)-dependent oxidoreductase [Acidimicrobiia bacterium]